MGGERTERRPDTGEEVCPKEQAHDTSGERVTWVTAEGVESPREERSFLPRAELPELQRSIPDVEWWPVFHARTARDAQAASLHPRRGSGSPTRALDLFALLAASPTLSVFPSLSLAPALS